jgi:ABC-type phosphate transport system substrate-binding protein
MRPFPISLLIAFLGLTAAGSVGAEPVVVVNARSGIERLSKDEVINIFLGRYRRLPNGIAALPIDQPEISALRAEFYRKLVNKDLNEINAYWSRLIFSGKTAPPRSAESAPEVLAWVAGNPGGVAYVERSQLDSRFRIVLEFSK